MGIKLRDVMAFMQFFISLSGMLLAPLYVIVRKAFRLEVWGTNINRTLLSLIPKEEHPEYIHQFRPISLCTVFCKTITKVIVNRLKPFLDELISPSQCSFVLGYQITDNIMVAQEVIHTTKNQDWESGLYGY